jgi:hypothetical protein
MARIPKSERKKNLDLQTVPFYGYERRKDPRVVWNFMQSIRTGDVIPPVEVVKLRDNAGFRIAAGTLDTREESRHPDGGHHRALAYLLLGLPFPVNIHGREKGPYPDGRSMVPLQHCQLIQNDTTFCERTSRQPELYKAIPAASDIEEMLHELSQFRLVSSVA